MCEALRMIMKEDFIKAETRGEARGEARGEIRGAVKTYRRMGKLPTEIICLIKADFSLSQGEAEKFVEETLGLQLV